jgi:hypothetical protein
MGLNALPPVSLPLQLAQRPSGDIQPQSVSNLLPEGWTPSLLDRDGDGDLGIAIVDAFTGEGAYPILDPNLPFHPDALPSHGEIVYELLTANYTGNDNFEFVPYDMNNDGTQIAEQLRLVLADVRAGRIDVVNLSLGFNIDLTQLPENLGLRSFNDLFEGESAEANRTKLLNFLEAVAPRTYQTIDLIRQIQEAGAIVVLAAENEPGEQYINAFSLPNPITVGPSDASLNSYYNVSAPSRLTLERVASGGPGTYAYNWDADRELDHISQQPSSLPLGARSTFRSATSYAAPLFVNQELLPYLLEAQ